MPKDISSGCRGTLDVRHHPYKPHSRGSDSKADKYAERKEWEDAVCPICLESPHNAVLLMCSSHDKGCRPFMCNTSYRHSNCLDQYRKSQAGLKKPEVSRQESQWHSHEAALAGEPLDLRVVDADSFLGSRRSSRRSSNTIHNHPLDPVALNDMSDDVLSLQITSMDSVFAPRRSRRHSPTVSLQSSGLHLSHQEVDSGEVAFSSHESNIAEHFTSSSPSKRVDVKDLLCPLCRGKVSSWKSIDAARNHLNGKSRSCSHETCTFSGNYEVLRAHARCEHPSVRPSEVDPARQRDWHRLERQRDMGDVLSSIRSAMPGAAVFGDYVIEDDIAVESDTIDLLGDEGNWWRVFFLFQIFGPAASIARERSISSRMRGQQQRHRRARTARLRQWVESFNHGSNEANNNTVGPNSTDEHAANTLPRRPRNPRRHWGDMS